MPLEVRENTYLTVYFPATGRALVFRVISVVNNGYSAIEYGALPISSGTILPTLDGGAAIVPEDGVLPARAYTLEGLTFPMDGVIDENDMWYLPPEPEWRDRLFVVRQLLSPAWIKIDAQIPPGVTQPRFQKNKVYGGIDKDFGFRRGVFEMVHLPGMRVGYRYANDTNLDVYTYVRFLYAECIVEIPRDAETIFNVLIRKIPSVWFSVPMSYMDGKVLHNLQKLYGIDGFPLYPADRREKALETYRELIRKLKG